jgi:hypothetical protein
MKMAERWKHLREDFVKHMAFGVLLIPLHSLLAVAASAAAVYFATTGRALIEQHPLSSLAAAVTAVPVIYLLYRGFVFRVRRHREYERIRQVAEGCGIEGFWGRATKAEKEDGWRDCAGKIAAAGSSEILIAGLTGAATFARDDAPLHDVVSAHKGDVRILLILKDSAAFDQRIDELSGGDDAQKEQLRTQFSGEISEALAFCRRLRSPKSVEIRQYDFKAIWKMVFFGEYLWLQHYQPDAHVDKTPAYVIHREAPSSLYHPLLRVFENRWVLGREKVLYRRDENGTYDPTRMQAGVGSEQALLRGTG